MKNGWTGGQYSVFRAVFGLYLCVHLAQVILWAKPPHTAGGLLFPNLLTWLDSPTAATVLLSAGVALSVLFAMGMYDRAAALGLWYVWACLYGAVPPLSNSGHFYVGWILLAHACLPAAPFWSWAARGRTDPAGNWHMPPPIFAAAWLLIALGYFFRGYTTLASDSSTAATTFVMLLEISFAPLALAPRARPWIWIVMLVIQLSRFLTVSADLSLGMIMLHFFTFDPGWIRPVPAATETIFYDGSCGLCHRSVRWILAEDRSEAFHFAPLEGDTFEKVVPEHERAGLPDSLVVRTADSLLLTRSAGVRHILKRLGGLWRVLAVILAIVPAVGLDRLYDGLAHIRYRLFSHPANVCPILPPHLRARFAL